MDYLFGGFFAYAAEIAGQVKITFYCFKFCNGQKDAMQSSNTISYYLATFYIINIILQYIVKEFELTTYLLRVQ